MPRSIADLWRALGTPARVLTHDDMRVEIWSRPDLDQIAAAAAGPGGGADLGRTPEIDGNPTRVIIAARLDRGEDPELQIGHQILECVEAAARQRREVVGVVSALGLCGELGLDERDDLLWILDQIRGGNADGTMVARPLRLTSSGAVASAFFARSEEAGGAVYFARAIAPGSFTPSA